VVGELGTRNEPLAPVFIGGVVGELVRCAGNAPLAPDVGGGEVGEVVRGTANEPLSVGFWTAYEPLSRVDPLLSAVGTRAEPLDPDLSIGRGMPVPVGVREVAIGGAVLGVIVRDTGAVLGVIVRDTGAVLGVVVRDIGAVLGVIVRDTGAVLGVIVRGGGGFVGGRRGAALISHAPQDASE
jgi:hypothetical protein